MWKEIWAYISTTGSMLAFIGSILTLIVNLFITRKNRKEGARAYIDTKMALAEIDLEKFPYEAGSRLIITDEYAEYCKRNKQEKQKYTFVQMKNISKNPCFGPRIKLKLVDGNKNIKHQIFDVYMLQENEVMYIPIISSEGHHYNVDTIEVTYKTLANEIMTYRSRVIQDASSQKVKVIESISIRKWFRECKLISTSGLGVNWKLLK